MPRTRPRATDTLHLATAFRGRRHPSGQGSGRRSDRRGVLLHQGTGASSRLLLQAPWASPRRHSTNSCSAASSGTPAGTSTPPDPSAASHRAASCRACFARSATKSSSRRSAKSTGRGAGWFVSANMGGRASEFHHAWTGSAGRSFARPKGQADAPSLASQPCDRDCRGSKRALAAGGCPGRPTSLAPNRSRSARGSRSAPSAVDREDPGFAR